MGSPIVNMMTDQQLGEMMQQAEAARMEEHRKRVLAELAGGPTAGLPAPNPAVTPQAQPAQTPTQPGLLSRLLGSVFGQGQPAPAQPALQIPTAEGLAQRQKRFSGQ
jgi:hypothetical protein